MVLPLVSNINHYLRVIVYSADSAIHVLSNWRPSPITDIFQFRLEWKKSTYFQWKIVWDKVKHATAQIQLFLNRKTRRNHLFLEEQFTNCQINCQIKSKLQTGHAQQQRMTYSFPKAMTNAKSSLIKLLPDSSWKQYLTISMQLSGRSSTIAALFFSGALHV